MVAVAKENKLFNSEKEIISILNSIDVGIHIVDSNGCTLFYSKTAEKIDGLKEKDVIGKSMNDLVEKGIFSRSIALLAIEKGEKVMMSQRVKDRLVFSIGIPIFREGELSKVIVISRDMHCLEQLKLQLDELRQENIKMSEYLSQLTASHIKENQLISKSKAMNHVIQLSMRVSQVNSTVIIEGESGTGKGMVAKFIHENSPRREQPFVKVDCSCIPETLVEAELFGYEEGSFTGAIKGGKKGLILSANQGTLFLDEIGELRLSMQVKLLTTIQDKTVQPVGSIKKEKVDVRIIAATNKSLYKMVQEGKFREDLYYRLRVIPINIPPLRERKADIVPLTNLFLNKFNTYYNLNKTISPKGLKVLLNYEWPGNVRELENEIERLLVTTEDHVIGEKDILELRPNMRKNSINDYSSFKDQVSCYERELLKEYMQNVKSVRELSEAAKIDESTLRKKAKRLGINLEFK